MPKVFIAAGHHPKAPGAGFEGFYEHDEADRWLDEMFKLDLDGRVLVRIPTGPLKDKADFVNRRCAPGDVALELHFNSAVNAAGERVGSGSVTLYCPNSEEGMQLAHAAQEVLKAHFPPDRGIVAGWYRGDQTRGGYYFLERTRCPAIILEPEFVHHRDLIQAKRAEVAPAIAVAMAAYVGEKL